MKILKLIPLILKSKIGFILRLSFCCLPVGADNCLYSRIRLLET